MSGQPPSPFAPLLRFHLGVGARLAARILAPAVVTAVGGMALLGVDFQKTLSGVFFGRGEGSGSGVAVFLLCLAVGAVAVPRICRGLDGWVRHLPVSGLAHRRAALLAVSVAEVPLLLVMIYLSFGQYHGAVPWLLDIAGVVLAMVAAAAFLLPVERPWLARPLALGAGFVAGSGSLVLLAAGAGLLVAADRVAGALSGPRRPPVRRGGPGFGWIEARILLRALGPRFFGAYAAAALGLAAAGFFVTNNELPAVHVALAARLGGSTAAVLLLAQMAKSLAALRPAWPWSRSLPWSAARRVRFDVLTMILAALPLAAVTAWIDPLSALPVLAFVPFLAARAAGAVRRAPERRTGASGEVFLQGLPGAAAVALLPWVALLLLAATPWALRNAAERERRQKVSRWLDLHHLAVGDPQSWSA
jgi:hypothetical protein